MALIGELTTYWLVCGVMVLCTLGIAAWVLTYPQDSRSNLAVLPAITAVLIVSYAAMAMEILTVPNSDGIPVTTARFIGYLFTYPLAVLYLGWLTDTRWRTAMIGSALVITFTVAVIGNWFLEGPLAALPMVTILGSMAAILWVLYKPMTRAAQTVSIRRQLTFKKIRNLLALIWIFYLIVGLTSRQGLGLLDEFTGVILGAYLDVIGHVGFAVLLLRAEETVDSLQEHAPPFLEYLRNEPPSR